MKNPVFLILLLSLGLLFTSYKWLTAKTAEDPAEATENISIENIMTRSSIRSYTTQTVSEETVDTLLRAAMAAPTAGNKQPWRFVVIDKREILDSIGAKFQSMTMAKEAALAVVMCGDPTATFPGDGQGYWIQDVSASSENLLLAAHALGLGAVWCGIYPMPDRVKDFSEMLRLPENIIPMGCICIGYPAGASTPKDKWNPDYIRYNSWA
ncbi:MAG: nitroreductase family protein [Muribaculaceae bacterium]|nr:nitroreductase family protein [Muribaculaceae bacterium]